MDYDLLVIYLALITYKIYIKNYQKSKTMTKVHERLPFENRLLDKKLHAIEGIDNLFIV